MITRKDLVEGLRVLHETDLITKIVTRAKRIEVFFIGENRQDCLLVLPNKTQQLSRHVRVSNKAMDAARKAVEDTNK